MNSCLLKYFGKVEITSNEVINILKNLLCATESELRQLRNNNELPACLALLVGELFRDINTGQLNTLSAVMDSVF
jgi:hypothetical protein